MKKETIIRKANLSDLKDIQMLNHLLFEKEYKEYDKLLNLKWTYGPQGTNYFKNKLSRPDNAGFVAVINKKVVGYIVGEITRAERYRNLPKIAEIDNMLVLEAYRGKGIGTLLYNTFLKWCNDEKVKIIRVQATAQNIQAINFYRKNGFNDYTLVLENNLGEQNE
jgi:diamine N-acetyltransferase